MAGEASSYACNCYKTPGLAEAVLETARVAYLGDRYALGEQLGWGQFGLIRSCSDLVTGESLACKSIAKERLVSPEDLRSVKLEIDVMARLSAHPNVVALRAVYEDERHVHLVMELCAGGELFHRLERHGRFPEPEAALLFRHLMQVVAYLHDRGVVHRDLKPENILLATRSSSSPIKLADFGLATYIRPGESLHGTVGSPFYIAPEVLAGGYNEAADVWSAGVILYILLSGTPPFWGKTKSRIFDAVRSAELRFPSDPWERVSDPAKELVAGMLCRDPAKRLTAKHVLDHPWIKECAQQSQSTCDHEDMIAFGQQDAGSCSFSTPLASRSRDVSFSCGTPVPCETQPAHSPTFSCRSSLSTFHVDATPCTPTLGFSFQSSCEPNSLGFMSPIPVMPSFTFYSPPHASNELEYPLALASGLSSEDIQRDPSFGELFIPPDSSACLSRNTRGLELKGGDNIRRGPVAASRTIGIHSKRNHTIGLGEFEQLDIMVSESVIRWASCTHLPSAPSLRSSLVC